MACGGCRCFDWLRPAGAPVPGVALPLRPSALSSDASPKAPRKVSLKYDVEIESSSNEGSDDNTEVGRTATKRRALYAMDSMILGENLDTLASYVPSMGLEVIDRTKGEPKPMSFEIRGVACIVDLSGFTKMCAELAEKGPDSGVTARPERQMQSMIFDRYRFQSASDRAAAAAESAEAIINENFAKLIDVIVEHGGDILRIAGDAIIVFFEAHPVAEHPQSAGSILDGSQSARKSRQALSMDGPAHSASAILDGSQSARKSAARIVPPPAARRSARAMTVDIERDVEDIVGGPHTPDATCAALAAHCALKCIELARPRDGGQRKLTMDVHVGMSFGTLRRFHVGDQDFGVCQVVMAGSPITEAGDALTASDKLQVVVSKPLWEQLCENGSFTGKPLEGELFLLDLSESELREPQRDIPLHISLERERLLLHWRHPDNVTEMAKSLLKFYVPGPVLMGATSGVGGELHEIRKLTCVFIDISLELQSGEMDAMLQTLNSIFQLILLHGVTGAGGLVKELTCDDKGLVCVLGFGFSEQSQKDSHTFESPSAAACRAAFRIEAALTNHQRHPVLCHIGVASGMVYCASLGNRLRRELAMVSSVMNTAARLMSAVKKGDKVDMSTGAQNGRKAVEIQMREKGARISAPVLPDFSVRLLVTSDVRQEADGQSGLFFHALPAIPLKGYAKPAEIHMVGSEPVELDEIEKLLDECRPKAVSKSRSTFASDGSFLENIDAEASDEGELMVPSQDDEGLSDVWHLSYRQYVRLVPVLFNQRSSKEAPELVWIRSSNGDPNLITAILQQLKADEPAVSSAPTSWGRQRAKSTQIVDLAEIVPASIKLRKMKFVSSLPPLSQLALKIIAVLGGKGDIRLVEHLLESVSFVKEHYTNLCKTFDRAYDQFSEGDVDGLDKSDILSIVLNDLSERGVLEVTSDRVHCNDFCLIDVLYQNMAFAHRRELHRMAAEMMAEVSRNEKNVAGVPLMIHHFMMAEDDARAESYLRALQGFLLFPGFVDKFIVDQVKKFVPSAVGLDGRTKEMNGRVARKCLQAIPYLRGFGKALLQQTTAATTQKAVTKFAMSSRSMRSRATLQTTMTMVSMISEAKPEEQNPDEDDLDSTALPGIIGTLKTLPTTGD